MVSRPRWNEYILLSRLGTISAIIVALSVLQGCISIQAVNSDAAPESVQETESPQEVDEDEPGGTEMDQPDPATQGEAGTEAPAPTERPLLQVTEDYWIETPWFGVSSIILVIKRTTPPTRIVVPEGTLLYETMRSVRGTVERLPTNLRKDRIQVGISFHIGDVPPFVDREAYSNPEQRY